MRAPLTSLLSKLSFRQQIALAFALGITCLAIASSFGITKVMQNLVYKQLRNNGESLTQAFATQATFPLLLQSEESIEESAKQILAFSSVIGITALTPEKAILYSHGVETSAAPLLDHGPNTPPQHSEDNNAWYFSLPVYAGEQEEVSPFAAQEPSFELVGFVQLGISKEALRTINNEILNTNLIIAFGLAAFLLLLLLAITNRVTKPLQNLAENMKLAEQGQTGVRAQLQGPKDVIRMENAFNSMMEQLENRQEELRRARDSALATAKIKGEFATTVSHELRTPMNGVMGMLELLSSMDLNKQQLEYVDVARTSGESLLQLIDDILDFSKFESGKVKINRSAFNPRDMLNSIVELLIPQAQQKNLILEGEVDRALPLMIVGDSGRIRQVLVNLVGNAIKFTQKGYIKIQITPVFDVSGNPQLNTDGDGDGAPTEFGDEKTTLSITVTDTGIGISEEDQKRIFEAFSQVDSSTTRQFGGTGLGLAISRQLAKLMGGNIGVRSRVEEGSTFWFTVPVTIAKETELKPDNRSEFANSRVLIVSTSAEHSHELLKIFKTLECFYRHTTSFTNALDFLERSSAQGRAYDFVVLDFDGNSQSEVDLLELINSNANIAPLKAILLTPTNRADLPGNALISESVIDVNSIRNRMQSLSKKPAASAPIVSNKPSAPVVPAKKVAHILVAEDNKTNQIVVSKFLEKLGHTFTLVDNGNMAIQALDRRAFDLVLMDCNMPVLNGYTATQLIRRKSSTYQNIPIIALTANSGPADYNRCFSSGMNDVILKPLTQEKLQERIKQWWENQLATSAAQYEQPAHLAVPKQQPAIKPPARREFSITSNDIESIQNNTLMSLKLQLGSTFELLIDSYLHDTPVHLQQLQHAVEREDWNQIKCVAHVVKGSSANVGAKRLLYLCQDIEDNCAERNLTGVKTLAVDVHAEFESVEKILRASDQIFIETAADFSRQQTILVVDDDNSSRIMLQGILQRDGYSVEQAANGIEAINACKQSMPDLILMDAMMPILDGISACEKILAMDCDMLPAILIITAALDEHTIEKAFAAGATDFIYKPINITVLRQRVSRLLHSGKASRHIRHLSYYDNLTSLPNRALFLERGRNLISNAAKNAHKVAIMFMDLDRFKLINDTLGHEAGDLLLKTFSQRLESCVRNADLVARLGGDEFAIVLDNIKDSDSATKVASKIVDSLSGPFSFMQQQLHITTSIGIALYPDSGTSIDDLMKRADTAMFRAKAGGGNTYEIYTAGMETEITQQMEMETEIRRALENDEFVLYYQPQVDLHTSEITGCEALIRWNHPKKGILAPIAFIPFAEKTGLINDIGTWVINRACKQLREWLDHEADDIAPIAVNVSGRELADNILLVKVKNALETYKIPAHLLKLEITEDTLVGSDESTTERLNELRDLGIMLAIDDFGTGYSSLSYLKIFPIDTLKIDRSFVRDIPDKPNSNAIISGIIALGHSLNLKIIAEGIETEQQKEFLREKGCDIMQGYLLSKPLPVVEFQRWAESHNTMRKFLVAKASGNKSAQPRH